MPRRSKRQRQQIDTETIQELQKDFSARFQEPKQKKGLRLKDVVALMQDQLRDALRKHWSYQDCCELLGEKNIHISPSTLQQYLRELNQEKSKTIQIGKQTDDDNDDDDGDIFSQSSTDAENENKSEGENIDTVKRFNTLDRDNL